MAYGDGVYGEGIYGGSLAPASLTSEADWGVLLNGVLTPGCALPPGSESCVNLSSATVAGFLTMPPDGLGLPGLRTGDVAFAQRDGVRHFNDFYEPRIITLEVSVMEYECDGCLTARQQVQDLLHAWSRQCGDIELVLFTDCHGEDPSVDPGDGSPLVGPFGVIGRPREARVSWQRSRGKIADILLRFDAVDHRLYVLDECGTPGSGEQCVNLTPSISSNCRTYDRCYTGGPDLDAWCYDVSGGQSGNEATAQVTGTLCSCATITLNGTLTDPIIENLTTGEKIQYNGTILAANAPVIINGSDGTATQNGVSRTHLLSGSPTFCLEPGDNELRLFSFGDGDDGNVDICWRNVVGNA